MERFKLDIDSTGNLIAVYEDGITRVLLYADQKDIGTGVFRFFYDCGQNSITYESALRLFAEFIYVNSKKP